MMEVEMIMPSNRELVTIGTQDKTRSTRANNKETEEHMLSKKSGEKEKEGGVESTRVERDR